MRNSDAGAANRRRSRRCSRKKSDPIGHWTTQLATYLQGSRLPMVIGMFPFDAVKAAGEGISMMDVWRWFDSLMGEGIVRPIVCAESLYLTNQAREYLQDLGQPYHCSAKPDRFVRVTKELRLTVKKPGQWSAMHNEATGEVAVHYWSPDPNVKKKFLLTTALRRERGKHPNELAPGWAIYKHMFSACDNYSQYFGSSMWPYRHSRWDRHLNDIYLTHCLLNMYAIWIELATEDRAGLTRAQFFCELGQTLHNWAIHARNHEFRVPP
mmetsp:Transcript_4051/g.12340  ORF Transcript_4051/g.12340 Transcript_4051/m.12340 type:complete len:267 (-) Transcript_4051:2463-3263(-)